MGMTSGFIFVLIAKYVTHSLSVGEKKKEKKEKGVKLGRHRELHGEIPKQRSNVSQVF